LGGFLPVRFKGVGPEYRPLLAPLSWPGSESAHLDGGGSSPWQRHQPAV